MKVPVLRDYQQTLADAVRDSYRQKCRCPLVVASTGAGKTILFSYITHNASLKRNPVLIAAHRKEIIRQISLSLGKFGVEHQVIAPANIIRAIKVAHFRAFGRSYVNERATTMVGSVQTIVGRLAVIDATMKRVAEELGKPASLLVVMDEGHHVVEDTMWGAVMEHCEKNHDMRGLLVTASPERLDGTGLGKGHGGFADVMIEAPPMSWLIENGYLSPYVIFGAEHPIDMTGAKKVAGEWKVSDAEARANKPSVTGDAISEWRKHANGMRTVVFCTSIKHSIDVAAAFNAAGIPAAHIDGGTDDTERDKAIMDFADGKLLVLTQVNLVSEGFDLASIAQKDVTIDCLVDLAPTESLVNAMQRWGRVLRPAPGKVAVILDQAANVGEVRGGEFKVKHGLPDAPRAWSLEGRKKGGRAADNDNTPDVVLRTCPECYAITKPVPVCPACGHVHQVQARKVEQKDGTLVDITAAARAAAEAAAADEQQRRQQRQQQGRAQTVEQMVATLGYSRGRAEKIVAAREEKAELQQQATQALADWYARHQLPVKTIFGIYSADIKTMKPKALRKLLDEIQADDEQRGGGFTISAVA